jgi:polysaccharide pyruvyl transferase WcaK-like protein
MIILYGYGGADNHGCEAIIRGTIELMPQNQKLLYSGNLRADCRYHLNELVTVRSDNYKYYNNPVMWIYHKKFKPRVLFPLLKGNVGGTYYSVGGDNYCYPGLAKQIGIVNQRIRNHGNKTVLWGTSIEENAIADERIRADLAQYDLIVARESITLELLHKYGISDRCVQMPDAAFAMKPSKVVLPDVFLKPVIGINLSPMVLDYSKNAETVKEGYKRIVEYIINQTECNIALVPHVVKKNRSNNDFETIGYVKTLIKDEKRLAVIDDMSADKLKYVISRCECFIGARTHSTIAAYSSGVPTLVVGYSIKALGIAKDIYGHSDGHVVDVRKISKPEVLRDAFVKMYDQRKQEREYLQSFIPEYKKGYDYAFKIIQERNLL